MLKSIKQAVLSYARGAGALARLRDSRWRRDRLLILGYHGVSTADEHEWDGALYMSPSQLRERFTMLASGGYTVLPLPEAVRRLYDHSLPDRAVVLTFDDGAHDFYREAYPLLQEFGFPGTVYLTTFYAHFQRPVFDTMCRYLLWRGQGRTLDDAELVGEGGPVRLAGKVTEWAVLRRIRTRATERKLDAEAKDAVLRTLAGHVGVDYDALLRRRFLHIMSPDEVSRLEPDLVSVQLHTHRHRVPVAREAFSREIRDNRDAIIAATSGEQPVHFCYPSGVTNPQFLPWLRELGVTSATTCAPGLASTASDPLLLPRFIDTSPQSGVEFEAWLTGAATLLPRRPLAASVVD